MFGGNFGPIQQEALNEAPQDRISWRGDASMSLDWQVVIYAATHEYVSRLTDDPSNTQFKGTLEKAFRIDRSIVDSNFIGESITIGLGEVTLTNSESDYDDLVVAHSSVGQRVKIRMGDRTRPYAEWKTILQGYLTDMQMDRASITFRMRDSGFKLDVPACLNIYAGTGGTEGTSDLENKRKPRWFGWNFNVTPPLVIPSSLAYQLNDGPIQSVSNVYVRGVAMSFGGDFPSVAGMLAASSASPDIGLYYTCLAEGWMRIAVASGSELGQVTVDFAGDKTGGTFAQTAADIVRRLLVTSGTELVDPDDLVESSFDQLNTDQGAPIGYGLGVGSEDTVASAVATIMAGIGGWCGARRSGRFEVARFDIPAAGSTPSALYSKLNIGDRGVAIVPLPSSINPPPWRITVGYQRVWTVQTTDIAGVVSDDRRAYIAEELRYSSAENISTKVDFPPGNEIVKSNANFRDMGDALTEAGRLLELFGSTARAMYVFKLCEPLYVHELGQVIEVDFPRFDLDGGKLLRIVKLSEDDKDGVEITAFG